MTQVARGRLDLGLGLVRQIRALCAVVALVIEGAELTTEAEFAHHGACDTRRLMEVARRAAGDVLGAEQQLHRHASSFLSKYICAVSSWATAMCCCRTSFVNSTNLLCNTPRFRSFSFGRRSFQSSCRRSFQSSCLHVSMTKEGPEKHFLLIFSCSELR